MQRLVKFILLFMLFSLTACQFFESKPKALLPEGIAGR